MFCAHHDISGPIQERKAPIFCGVVDQILGPLQSHLSGKNQQFIWRGVGLRQGGECRDWNRRYAAFIWQIGSAHRHAIRDGRINLVGHGDEEFGAEQGGQVLAQRAPRPDLKAEAALPDDTRLWAALQRVGGGTWGGCVYDVDAIVKTLEAGRQALEQDL